MLLDLAPLTRTHLVLFGCTFLAVFLLIGALLRTGAAALRPHASKVGVFYGGALLAGVIGLIGYVVLDDVRLKIGLLAAVFLTLLIGVVDEQLKLSAGVQFAWQVVIASIAVGWGWTISYVSHPFHDSVVSLSWYDFNGIVLPGAFLAVLWLVFLMNAMNWLDGVDGLASGVGTVALLTLGLVSLLPQTQDSETLTLVLIGAGGMLGFLLWNFPPAKVYLGTSGSWFLGLYIGMVAIVGGGKIVTTLLVLALPVLDVLFVIVQRLLAGEKPWAGDTQRHLHYVLRRAGWRSRSIALFSIAISAMLGAAALTLQTTQKLAAFMATAVILAITLIRLLSRGTRVKSTV